MGFAEPHGDKSIGLKIRLEESSCNASAAEESFGGEIAAADSTFHGCRPASVRPIPCQEQARNGSMLLGAPAIHAGLG